MIQMFLALQERKKCDFAEKSPSDKLEWQWTVSCGPAHHLRLISHLVTARLVVSCGGIRSSERGHLRMESCNDYNVYNHNHNPVPLL